MNWKFRTILFLLCPTVLLSCNDKDEGNQLVYYQSIVARLSETAPKVGDDVPAWTVGDEIKVAILSDGMLAPVSSRYTLSEGGGTKSGTFVSKNPLGWEPGSRSYKIMVVHPHSAAITSEAINVEIPAVQTQNGLTKTDFSNTVYFAGMDFNAVPENIEVSLETLTAWLGIDLGVAGTPLAGEDLNSISLESDIPVAGNIEYDISTGTFSKADKTSVTLKFDGHRTITDRAMGWFTLCPADLPKSETGATVKITTDSYEAVVSAKFDTPLVSGAVSELKIDLKDKLEKGEAAINFIGDGELVSSNAYILAPGSSVLIPVKRAYEVWNEYFDTDLDGKEANVEILWEDHAGLLESHTLQLQSRSENDIIKVDVSNNGGNALIALVIDGEIRWSWHLWVTDFDPDAAGSTVTYNGVEFMLRNLGAMNNTPQDGLSAGLLYQWGRKDPFPGAIELVTDSDKTKPIYDASGNRTNINRSAVGEDRNLRSAVSNPTTFYYTTAAPWDWYTRIAGEKNDYLWNDPAGNKTVFDPCPHGWRVPVSDHSSLTLSIWKNPTETTSRNDYVGENNEWLNGWDFNMPGYELGYHPAAGYLYNMYGTIFMVNTYGTYWSALARADATTAYRFMFSPTLVQANGAAQRSFGSSVRCVRE